MAASRRPSSGRRPATRSRATARTSVGPSRRPTPPAAEVRGPRALTTRAAVLGLLLCGLLVSAALPLRSYLAQRDDLAAAQAANAAAEARVRELENLQARLNDPAYVKAQAREKLHFVLPGETSFLLIPDKKAGPAVTSAPSAATPQTPVGATAPWYSQLYGTVQAADER